ncbi:multicopper oxidase domain-containing protein [Streptomyces avermitilis]
MTEPASRAARSKGMHMLHCPLLQHEDEGMMASLMVTES